MEALRKYMSRSRSSSQERKEAKAEREISNSGTDEGTEEEEEEEEEEKEDEYEKEERERAVRARHSAEVTLWMRYDPLNPAFSGPPPRDNVPLWSNHGFRRLVEKYEQLRAKGTPSPHVFDLLWEKERESTGTLTSLHWRDFSRRMAALEEDAAPSRKPKEEQYRWSVRVRAKSVPEKSVPEKAKAHQTCL